MPKDIAIATRKSPLALWQAEHVSARLRELDSDLTVQLVSMTTKGDKILDQALSKVGGKDLFVKEIEAALLDGRAQVAVHSLKDMPTTLPDGLEITAYPKREDPRDAIVSTQGFTLDTLPKGARLGTCSLRRAAQLKRKRPDLEIVPIRGNVQTRLRKLDEENMHATVLAYAGLKRLELESVATDVLDPEDSLPAIGQGILGVETRADDESTNALVGQIDDLSARAAALTERAFLHRLEGGCQVPIAGHAVIAGDKIFFRGLVASVDGQRVIEGSMEGAIPDAEEIGEALADKLLAEGAKQILDELKET